MRRKAARNAHARRARCSPAPMARGGRGDAPAAAEAGARGVHVAAPHPRRAYPTIYRPKRATPYRITTRHIYPRIYHATHPQKPPPPAPSRVSCVLRTLATLTAAPAALPFAAKTAHATASVGWVWDPPASERRPREYRAQHGPRPQGAGHANQLFSAKRLTRRKDGAIIPASNAEGGRAGMKAARMDHSSAYYFTFSFTFARKALLRCAV